MAIACELKHLTKRYGNATALDDLSLTVAEQRVIGLIGRNGCGKTTFLHHLLGLLLPTKGTCTTLGVDTTCLGPGELRRIGVVYQENRFLEWMTVRQHLRYVASFYQNWDKDPQDRLLNELELDSSVRVANLSPGDVQKMGLIIAVCHHPELLLLDETVSDMDPIARQRLLTFFLDLLHEDACTIIISSHILRDIEQIVDWIVCLDAGKIAVSAGLDELQGRYEEWVVTSKNGELPASFDEDFVCKQQGDDAQAQLLVQDAADRLDAFQEKHMVLVESRPLNLERMFPLPAGRRTMNPYAFTQAVLAHIQHRGACFSWSSSHRTYKALEAYELHTAVEAWFFPRAAESLLLIVPIFCGFLVGSAVVEVYNGRFSWTLPAYAGISPSQRSSAVRPSQGLPCGCITLMVAGCRSEQLLPSRPWGTR